MRDEKGRFISPEQQINRSRRFRERVPDNLPMEPEFYHGASYTAKPNLDEIMAQNFGEWAWEWFVILSVSVLVGTIIGIVISYLF